MEVVFDVNPLIKRLDAVKAVQVPFATSLAINRVAKIAREELREQMKQTFDNPVPFTLNSVYIKSSTKSNLYAEVGLKEFATKGNPASKYLLPQITGGPAYATRFQKSLRYKGLIAENEYAIPTQSDMLKRRPPAAGGNIRPSQYTEILYDLAAFRDSSAFVYKKNAKKRRNKTRYVARTTAAYNSGGPRDFYPGIYAVGPKVPREDQALFWFTRTPQNQAKFPLLDIAGGAVRKNWSKEFGRALAEAIATAR